MQATLKRLLTLATLTLAGCNSFNPTKGVEQPIPTVACVMMPDGFEACKVR